MLARGVALRAGSYSSVTRRGHSIRGGASRPLTLTRRWRTPRARRQAGALWALFGAAPERADRRFGRSAGSTRLRATPGGRIRWRRRVGLGQRRRQRGACLRSRQARPCSGAIALSVAVSQVVVAVVVCMQQLSLRSQPAPERGSAGRRAGSGWGNRLVELEDSVWVVAGLDLAQTLIVRAVVRPAPIGEVGVGEVRIDGARAPWTQQRPRAR